MQKRNITLLIVGFISLITLFQAFFTVDQIQRAIVLQFGKPVSPDSLGPGLHLKIPFIQDVIHLDARILDYDAKPEEILTEDKKNMVVDSYAKWKIVDALAFYRNFKTVHGAMSRLDDMIRAQLREVLGRYKLHEVVSAERGALMDEVSKRTQEALLPFGIKVMDVRIKRTDLPPENERAIYNRMRAERERQAKEYRAEGQEEAAKIRAQAEKERAVLLATARKDSEIIRGEGDAQATKIYADAFERSPDFYEFKRSLEAYEQSLQDNTSIILTPKSPFLKHFR